MLKLQLKGLLLIQAQQLQIYLRNIDDALAWIVEHESTVFSHEMGADLERNEVLQKKFDVFMKVGSETWLLKSPKILIRSHWIS